MKRLPVAFFARDATVVAPELLNKRLVVGGCAGRIVEVEAYTSDDPASHSFRGRTVRNDVMFGPPGRLYVYFTYGMHHCANVTTGRHGDGQAILLRAALPLEGIELMRTRRHDRPDRLLANGPGKLAEAFALGLGDNGQLAEIYDDGTPPPADPLVGPRVGITKGADWPRRYRVPPPT